MPIGEKEQWRPGQIRQSSTGFDDSELLRKARVNSHLLSGGYLRSIEPLIAIVLDTGMR
jgi:hypothetical protein